MLNKVEENGSIITSFPIGKGPLRINHLFFVDDSLLFYKANSLEWSQLIRPLKNYERALG